MLSRILPETGIHTIDCDDWVDPTAIPKQDAADVLPLLYDGPDLKRSAKQNRKSFVTFHSLSLRTATTIH